MKTNKLKAILIAICCLVIVFCTATYSMDANTEQSEPTNINGQMSNIRNTDDEDLKFSTHATPIGFSPLSLVNSMGSVLLGTCRFVVNHPQVALFYMASTALAFAPMVEALTNQSDQSAWYGNYVCAYYIDGQPCCNPSNFAIPGPTNGPQGGYWGTTGFSSYDSCLAQCGGPTPSIAGCFDPLSKCLALKTHGYVTLVNCFQK